MKKNEYKRPLMIVENFVPNEFIATCWYVESGKCYSKLYHDVRVVGGGEGHDGLFNWILSAEEENMYYDAPHGSGEHRLPLSTDNPKWFQTDGPVSVVNDGYYYTDYKSSFLNLDPELLGRISKETPLYVVRYNDKNHYFSEYKTDGNHS